MEKPGVLPSEPLERYFDKGIWARAKAFAMEDATKDASHTLHTRGAAEREAATLKWTALRSKRDRTVERFRYVLLSRRRFGGWTAFLETCFACSSERPSVRLLPVAASPVCWCFCCRNAAPVAPKVYGYGPDGPWEQVTQPPIFSVLKAHAVPSNKRGLALATAIAVQNKVRPSRDGHALEHTCGIYIIALR